MWRACRLPRLLLFLLSIASTACAPTTKVQWQHPATEGEAPKPSIAVFVMWPFFDGVATGNSGSNFEMNEQALALEILGTLREHMPSARLIRTSDERMATRWAVSQGATHLLVPVINEWRQMRTDDPIGAFTLAHNRIMVTLRLLRLQPMPRPAIETGRVTFSNRARITLNQSATTLLNDRFHDVVRELIRTGT